MYHLRMHGSHYGMGRKRGEIFNKCGICFPLNMDSFQMEHGIESEKILNSFYPEICQEMHGVADTIGADYHKFASWMLAMGCCMYNLEENAPEIRGCTAFSISGGGRVFYARNNDLPPFLEEGSKSEIYTPDAGNRFNLTTSSFINGEEGINVHGLAVAMTFVSTRLEDIRPGFNSVFIVRYLLEKTSTASEALDLLLPLPVASNCNILIADRTGEMMVCECSPSEKNIRKPVILPDGTSLVCTVNSFTSALMKKYEWEGEETFSSEERYNTVLSAAADHFPPASGSTDSDWVMFLEKLLKGEFGFMCQYDKSLNFKTVWSSVFNLKTLQINRAEGDPRRKKFILDTRLMPRK